ncbi:G-protein coupled receptors family 1 profile domain-containing protein [Caenorhabditis elegans]|nr:G-protein coupled receptors family 1 profile domain-containing protein [Caenorhabditis elegans]CAA98955.2 G-protein coupled receptors family 1 profile domain-containing protein [Caenorhabditis elegans]|eukprot:NP_506168.2 FMRFamide Peptide Receptor family [Caenorhabditis elegans]
MSLDDEFNKCQEIEFTHAQFLFRSYLFPFVYLFGIISNSINICVFSQKSMRNHTVNWFFLALSFSDLLTLVASIFVFSVPVYAENSHNPEYIDLSVQLIVWFYPLAQIGLTMSVYVTILVSVHRYLGVCHPFLIRRISNSNAVKAVIVAAIVFAFVFNASRWFELHAQPCSFGTEGQTNSSVVYPTSLMMNRMYTLIFRNAAYTIVMFFLPFAILTYVNLRIIATLKQSYKMRKAMTTSRSKRSDSTVPTDTIVTKIDGYSAVVPVENGEKGNGILMGGANNGSVKNDKKENGVTVMLVAITTEFLLFNLIAFATNIIELSSIRFFADLETLLVELSTFLVNVNGASTIIIYLIFGSKYRNVFIRLFRKNLGHNFCGKSPKRPIGYSQAHFETTQLLDNSRFDLNRSKQASVIRKSDLSPSTRSSSSRRPTNS